MLCRSRRLTAGADPTAPNTIDQGKVPKDHEKFALQHIGIGYAEASGAVVGGRNGSRTKVKRFDRETKPSARSKRVVKRAAETPR